MLKVILTIAIAAVVLMESAFIIQEPEQCLILEFGKPVRIIREPGLYFKYPLAQRAVILDKRVLVADARPAEYITLDKKRLTVDTVSRWKIVEPLQFYQSVKTHSGAVDRLNDVIFGRLRQAIANHNFIEFVREERENIMNRVTKETAELAKENGFGIDVIDVRIKRVDLPEEVQNSVFARMRAERERIAKRYRAEGEERGREIRATAEKEREIISAEAYEKSQALRGEGDAEATGIYAGAYTKDAEFFSFIRHLEVYKRVFGAETTFFMRPDSDLFKYLGSSGGSSKPSPDTSRGATGK